MQILRINTRVLDIPLKSCARKNAISIGINRTSMAMNIRTEEPENHIMRDSDANTAVSSLAMTLPHANRGDNRNVKNARNLRRFAVLSISLFLASLFQTEGFIVN